MDNLFSSELVAYDPKWEYHWADYETTTSAVGEATVLLFAKLGAEGWDCIHTELIQVRRWRRKYRSLFKRIKAEDVEN